MNKKNKRILLYLLLTLFVLTGCKVKRPKHVLSESTMEELLYDFHIAKAMGEGLSYTENYKKQLYVDDVLRKYNVTQADFDSSLVWYTRNTKIMFNVYEKVNKRLKADLDEVKKLISIRDNKPVMSDSGDSIDVWFMERIYRLTGYPLSNRISFNLPHDTCFYDRDTLSWQVRYNFLGHVPDSNAAPLMAMHIIYNNDSIISDSKRIYCSGSDTLRLQADTLGSIKEIKGFIYYNNESRTSGTLWLDSIKLMRYHSRDTLTVHKAVPAADKEEAANDAKKDLKPTGTPIKLSDIEVSKDAKETDKRRERRPMTGKEVKQASERKELQEAGKPQLLQPEGIEEIKLNDSK